MLLCYWESWILAFESDWYCIHLHCSERSVQIVLLKHVKLWRKHEMGIVG